MAGRAEAWASLLALAVDAAAAASRRLLGAAGAFLGAARSLGRALALALLALALALLAGAAVSALAIVFHDLIIDSEALS